MPTYLEQSLRKLEEFEGSVPWMYRDTVGKVTVAVGLMLPDHEAACKLPFLLEGRPATASEIAGEYARVDGMPMGRPALFYRGKGRPELAEQTVKALLSEVVEGIESHLRRHFAGYDQLPDGAKMALIDMTYNLGIDGLLGKFPKFVSAIRSGNFAQAARDSFRHGPNAARNEWTRAILAGGLLDKVVAAEETVLKRIGYGLVGMLASWFGR